MVGAVSTTACWCVTCDSFTDRKAVTDPYVVSYSIRCRASSPHRPNALLLVETAEMAKPVRNLTGFLREWRYTKMKRHPEQSPALLERDEAKDLIQIGMIACKILRGRSFGHPRRLIIRKTFPQDDVLSSINGVRINIERSNENLPAIPSLCQYHLLYYHSIVYLQTIEIDAAWRVSVPLCVVISRCLQFVYKGCNRLAE